MGKIKSTLPDYNTVEYMVIGEPGTKLNKLVQWSITLAHEYWDKAFDEGMTVDEYARWILELHKQLDNDFRDMD